MDGWKCKNLWRKCGDGFCVEISHHTVDTNGICNGPHRWCVYAYIYPNHALFPEFDGDDMFQDATMRLPMHGCPSYIKWHRDDKGYTSSVQVGADYNRIGDNDYTYMDSKEAAESVFLDAEKLTAFLASDFSAVEQENS